MKAFKLGSIVTIVVAALAALFFLVIGMFLIIPQILIVSIVAYCWLLGAALRMLLARSELLK